jgi:acetolactate synthase I/II/III large subunit
MTRDPAPERTGAEILLEALVREGVDTIFGYPGGANLPIYQHLPEFPNLKHVLVRHEQGAAHMADGYSRASRRVGVCFATSGPGALNLTTGLATAFMDSVPMVAITGQVPTAMVGRDAFQESDVIGVSMPITKHSYLVTDVKDIAKTVKEAFYVARTGRPGPVLIDLPRDLQQKMGPWVFPDTVGIPWYKPVSRPDPAAVAAAARALTRAKRPVILAGHGVILSAGEEALLKVAEKQGIPVGTTLLGVGAFPVQHPLALHLTGFMGTGWNLNAVIECDCLAMVGMRVDDRVTAKLDGFAPNCETFIHIDIDPSEHGKNVRPQISIVADAREALEALERELPEQPYRTDWLLQIDRWREEHPLRARIANGWLQPQEVLIEMYRHAKSEAIVVADVGQNQIWAALWWNYDRPGLFINSGGSGTMGFAFPAAVGAKFARPEKTVFCVSGEGGFVMTMQELSTAVEHNVDVKIVILNNASLGMVRQFQDKFYGGVRSAVDLSVMPDFVKLADAFGLPGYRARTVAECQDALAKAMAHNGPVLIDFVIDPEANVYPIIPLGKQLKDFVEEPLSA